MSERVGYNYLRPLRLHASGGYWQSVGGALLIFPVDFYSGSISSQVPFGPPTPRGSVTTIESLEDLGGVGAIPSNHVSSTAVTKIST